MRRHFSDVTVIRTVVGIQNEFFVQKKGSAIRLPDCWVPWRSLGLLKSRANTAFSWEGCSGCTKLRTWQTRDLKVYFQSSFLSRFRQSSLLPYCFFYSALPSPCSGPCLSSSVSNGVENNRTTMLSGFLEEAPGSSKNDGSSETSQSIRWVLVDFWVQRCRVFVFMRVPASLVLNRGQFFSLDGPCPFRKF